MDLARILLAWLLVMMMGTGLVRIAYARTGSGSLPHPAWQAGTGFLAGAFVLTLYMRLLSAIGAPFTIASIGIAVCVAAVGVLLPLRRELRAAVRRGAAALAQWRPLAGLTPTRVAWGLLCAWLLVRAGLLLGEVLRQPLFPWDAWTQWGTKAHVWFALRHMVPFEQATQWLQGGSAYYDAAPHYPATVPLWQVWSSVALGRYDDALMNLPWWFCGVALALLLYGFFRDERASPLFALVATWMIVSMPIVETHVALAGYADLPMASYLTAAALAGLRAVHGRSRGDLILAVLFAAALPTIKNPGWIWIAVLLPGVLVALMPRRGPRIVLAAWVAGIALVFLLGRYEPIIFGYHLHFQVSVPWHGLMEAYLSFANWHLLFWAVPPIVLATWRWVVGRDLAPLSVVVGSGALFLLLGFSLTSAAIWVEDQSTVNRATLHLAPLLGAWLVLLVARALDATAPAARASVPAPAPDAPATLTAAAPAVALPGDAHDA
jgi:hypothetical protein